MMTTRGTPSSHKIIPRIVASLSDENKSPSRGALAQCLRGLTRREGREEIFLGQSSLMLETPPKENGSTFATFKITVGKDVACWPVLTFDTR